MKQVNIYTDGSCLKNPGPGGYAFILEYKGHRKEVAKGFPHTTNNQMELLAVINAINQLTEPCEINLYSDSKYTLNGLSLWMENWKRNNWLTKEKKPVQNLEFWKMLDQVKNKHNHIIKTFWIEGHSGHPENERCDELARAEARKYTQSKNTNSFND